MKKKETKKTKKWRVYANVPTIYETVVKATTEEEAIGIALTLEADDWEEVSSGSDFILPNEGSSYEPSAQEV